MSQFRTDLFDSNCQSDMFTVFAINLMNRVWLWLIVSWLNSVWMFVMKWNKTEVYEILIKLFDKYAKLFQYYFFYKISLHLGSWKLGIYYRTLSEASEGYVFTGVCHSFCSTAGGGVVINTNGQPPPPPGPGQNVYPLPPPPLHRLHAGGRYASYWNAFLLESKNIIKRTRKTRRNKKKIS